MPLCLRAIAVNLLVLVWLSARMHLSALCSLSRVRASRTLHCWRPVVSAYLIRAMGVWVGVAALHDRVVCKQFAAPARISLRTANRCQKLIVSAAELCMQYLVAGWQWQQRL
jgi:hypothetical protein